MDRRDWQRLLEPTTADLACRQQNLERLRALVYAWQDTGREPAATAVLSGGEHRAVCLAAQQPRALKDPLGDFLLLDGWLQRWVLECLGMQALVGQVIGDDLPPDTQG